MISIIIPTYLEEKYIADAISQFKGLKMSHEIIVTDDKSPDRTVEIAKSFGAKVVEVKVKHKTIAANRNHGARAASGEYLAFFDTDSRIKDANKFFDRSLQVFNKNKNIMAITGTFWVTPESAVIMDRIIYAIFNLVHQIKNNVIHVGEAPGKFQMIRREAFDKINGFNETLVSREDADIFQRLNKIGRTYCDRKLVIYHSGRRAHTIGWPKLLWIWMRDAFLVATKKKSGSEEWKAYR